MSQTEDTAKKLMDAMDELQKNLEATDLEQAIEVQALLNAVGVRSSTGQVRLDDKQYPALIILKYSFDDLKALVAKAVMNGDITTTKEDTTND